MGSPVAIPAKSKFHARSRTDSTMVGHLSGNDEELTNDDQKITPRVIRFVSSAVEYDKIFWHGNFLLCAELLNRTSDLWKSSPNKTPSGFACAVFPKTSRFATARTRPPETRKTARLTSTTQKGIATKSDIDARKIDVMIFVMSADMLCWTDVTNRRRLAFASALVVWR